MNELWKKKQSDVLRFLQRVRCWEYRHQNRMIRVPHPTRPEKARRMGYKRKTGYVVMRIRVCTFCVFLFCIPLPHRSAVEDARGLLTVVSATVSRRPRV